MASAPGTSSEELPPPTPAAAPADSSGLPGDPPDDTGAHGDTTTHFIRLNDRLAKKVDELVNKGEDQGKLITAMDEKIKHLESHEELDKRLKAADDDARNLADIVNPRIYELESTELQDKIVEVQGINIEQTLMELTSLKDQMENLKEQTEEFKDTQAYQDIKGVHDRMDDMNKNIEKFENMIDDAQRESSLIRGATEGVSQSMMAHQQDTSERIQNLTDKIAGLEQLAEDIKYIKNEQDETIRDMQYDTKLIKDDVTDKHANIGKCARAP